jgi:hypothetical protein
MPVQIYRIGMLLIVGLWTASLFFPAIDLHGPIFGGWVLVYGAMGVLSLNFAWFANLLIVPVALVFAVDQRRIPRALLVVPGLMMPLFLAQSVGAGEINDGNGAAQVTMLIGGHLSNSALGLCALLCWLSFIERFWHRD